MSFILDSLDEDGRKELWASMALRHCSGLGARGIRRLLEEYGSAYVAFCDVDSWTCYGISNKVIQNIRNELWRDAALQEWAKACVLRGDVLLWTDPRYPLALRELPDAPCFLYVRGDLSLLYNPTVAIVGMRQCTPKGIKQTERLAGALAAAGITVISGLAKGIDTAAHNAAIDLPGGTIAVLGTGLDVPYPHNNTDLYQRIAGQGLLISENPPGTTANPRCFPIRNRLISGLSLGVLVVQAAQRSGSLITARCALEQNRAVYAVGGDIDDTLSHGCQELIRQGAQVIFSADDILQDLAVLLRQDASFGIFPSEPPLSLTPQAFSTRHAQPSTVKKHKIHTHVPLPPHSDTSLHPTHTPKPVAQHTLNAVAEQLLAALRTQACTVDTLCDTLDLSAAVVSAELTVLEVKGYIRRLPDTRYECL